MTAARPGARPHPTSGTGAGSPRTPISGDGSRNATEETAEETDVEVELDTPEAEVVEQVEAAEEQPIEDAAETPDVPTEEDKEGE